MIIYEMNMLYGDLFDAFLEKRQGLNFPTFFATACGSEPHADWWLYNKRENLKAKHIVGKLQVAGFSVLPEEVPQDVMEQSPNPPQLGNPDELIKTWYHDQTFGSRFCAFLDEFYKESSCFDMLEM